VSEERLLPFTPAAVPAGAGKAAARPASTEGSADEGRPAARVPRLFAFASGKGGVGKSLLIANLGIQLARQGRTATLLDCDLASASLHSYLGAGVPASCLDDLLRGAPGISLASLARDTSVPGLRLIAGPRQGWRSVPPEDEIERLVLQAHELACDCVLIDLPSGRHPLALDLLALCDAGVVITTPEPGSLEGAFRLIEQVARRALDRPQDEDRKAAEAVLGAEALARGTAAFLDGVAELDPALAQRLGARLTALRLSFIINQSRSDAEAQAGLNLRSLCRHYLGVEIDFGGVVEFDLSAWQATRQRKSLSQKYPNAPATRTIEQMAAALAARAAAPPAAPPRWVPLAERTLYEILEVPLSASQRDLQRSYDRLQTVTAHEADGSSVATHPERARALRARIETAYRTLVFLESRGEYDRSLVAAGRARPEELRNLSLETASPRRPAAPNASPASHAAPAPPRPASSSAEAASQTPAASDVSPPAPSSVASIPAPAADAQPPDPAATGTGAAGVPGPRLLPGDPERPPRPRPADAAPPPDPTHLVSHSAAVSYSGALLAALRRERGLSLEAIAAVSKVRTAHLRCVEEERFAELPAPVFLKGFVREYARCLSLDPDKVWLDYLSRYNDWKKARGADAPRRPS
jgi:flagellar biosynthesis protein FlhG